MSGQSNFGSPDLRLPLLATQRDSDLFHQARTSSGGDRDNDSTLGAPGDDLLQQDGSAHAPWTPNESPRSVQALSYAAPVTAIIRVSSRLKGQASSCRCTDSWRGKYTLNPHNPQPCEAGVCVCHMLRSASP